MLRKGSGDRMPDLDCLDKYSVTDSQAGLGVCGGRLFRMGSVIAEST